MSGSEQPLYGEERLRKTKDAVGGADAFQDLLDDINEAAATAGPGCEHATHKRFNLTLNLNEGEGEGIWVRVRETEKLIWKF